MILFNLIDQNGDVVANGTYAQCDSVLVSHIVDEIDTSAWRIEPASELTLKDWILDEIEGEEYLLARERDSE